MMVCTQRRTKHQVHFLLNLFLPPILSQRFSNAHEECHINGARIGFQFTEPRGVYTSDGACDCRAVRFGANNAARIKEVAKRVADYYPVKKSSAWAW